MHWRIWQPVPFALLQIILRIHFIDEMWNYQVEIWHSFVSIPRFRILLISIVWFVGYYTLNLFQEHPKSMQLASSEITSYCLFIKCIHLLGSGRTRLNLFNRNQKMFSVLFALWYSGEIFSQFWNDFIVFPTGLHWFVKSILKPTNTVLSWFPLIFINLLFFSFVLLGLHILIIVAFPAHQLWLSVIGSSLTVRSVLPCDHLKMYVLWIVQNK